MFQRAHVRLAAVLVCLVTPAFSANAQTLPTGWTSRDIGAPSLSGSSIFNSGTFMVTGAGSDIWGTADQFRFVYQQVTGDLDIVARVPTLQSINAWTKGGLMIRASLNANGSHASVLLTPGNGIAFQRRASTGATSVHTGVAGTAPIWLKLQRRGNTITAFGSTNGTSWTAMGTQTLTLPSPFYVGLAVTSHDTAQRATATFSTVSIIQGGGTPGNQLPAVSLTWPAAGATYTAPATIPMTATASDANGTVIRVDFYAGTTLVGSDTSGPYGATWSGVSAGTYSLTAIAYDNSGASTTSGARTVSVSGGSSANQSPSVALTAPTGGASFTAPASIPLNATATDGDGSVTRVDFYSGTTLIASDTTSPYGLTWTNVGVGSYPLTAVARDNGGATTVSDARDITVLNAAVPTRAIFSPSTDHATGVTRYVLEIFQSGVDPSTSNPVATQDLGKPAVMNNLCTVDVGQTIAALPAGVYIATVTAVGPTGSTESNASPPFTR